MNRLKRIFVFLVVCVLMMNGCGKEETQDSLVTSKKEFPDAVNIVLSDSGVTVNGEAASENTEDRVYVANDIVFYLANQGFTYGEGNEEDEHTQEEADKHTVVHITKPGTYAVTGKLSAGQIAIDLGKDAKEDSQAVVTLILNGVDITCSVAPGIIFYNVYECGSKDTDVATYDVDTTAAGANIMIADESVNRISGSYVARIYETYELNEDGTEVASYTKLHKYDGAVYSKRTLNVNGDIKGNGVLNIWAENEGLDSELHLTINGGNINITSGNDGINTNEDGVSVTTMNGGKLSVLVDGSTGEGDGIDSNGWLVMNGGSITAAACSVGGDAGIDSDRGIYINGGSVSASGNMLDQIAGGEQTYVVFHFMSHQKGGITYRLKNTEGENVLECTPENDFSYLIVAGDELTSGSYTFWKDNTQLAGSQSNMGNMGILGGMEGFSGEMPEGMEHPEGMERPEGMEMPEGMERPEGMEMPNRMEGQMPDSGHGSKEGRGQGQMSKAESSEEFVIGDGANYFSNVTEKE